MQKIIDAVSAADSKLKENGIDCSKLASQATEEVTHAGVLMA